MTRSSRLTSALLAAVVAAGACDRGGLIAIQPEVDDTSGFESGLGSWSPGSSGDAGTIWTVESTSEASSVGSGSARIVFLAASTSGKVWLERDFAVDSTRAYEVTVEYALGTTEGEGVTAWDLVAGAGGSSLGAAQVVPRGVTEGGSGGAVHWVPRTHAFTATSGSDGTLRVAVGIGAGSTDSRTYYIDELRVTLLRR